MSYAKKHLKNKKNLRCHYCSKVLSKKVNESSSLKATIDHVIPISKGGKNTKSNVVVSCQKCNNKKGSKDYYEFIEELGWLEINYILK